jgi:methyl-accepting chemotaxis protein
MKTAYQNLNLSTRLLLISVIPIFIISAILGGLGYFNITQISSIIHEIVNQRVPTLTNLTKLERVTYQMVMDQKSMIASLKDARLNKAAYQQATLQDMDDLTGTLDKLDSVANQYQDQDLLKNSNDVRQVSQQYKELFNASLNKINDMESLSTAMEENGKLVIDLTNALFKDIAYQKDTDSAIIIPILVDILNISNNAQNNQTKYMLYQNEKFWEEAEKDLDRLSISYNELKRLTTNKSYLSRIENMRTATEDYLAAAKSWNSTNSDLNSVVNQMETIGTRVREYARIAEDSGWAATETSKVRANEIVRQSTVVNIGSALIALLIGLILGFLSPRSITRPIKIINQAAKNISEGDIDQRIDIQSKDEIGELAQSFQTMINYMQDMAATAISISNGDLTTKVKPKSDRDILGNAFKMMVRSLKDAITLVSASAADLDASSSQLASSAEQAAEATQQISQTVQQVAIGTTQQAESSTRTVGLVDRMSSTMRGVEQGAKDQGNAAARAAELTAALSEAIQQVGGNAQAVTHDSNLASEAAKQGTLTVQTTIEGMRKIQAKVGVSAQKVQEMGNRSKQIGAIVETIDDIASQTNLLALNAAIEAARAGEHGKGFAVVADEVRKLAERSSTATKEIAQLIKGIQHTVEEAVRAMSEGAAEVQNGVALANESGQALKNILSATEAVYVQASQATEATVRMNSFSEDLVKSVDEVARIAETNSIASDDMKKDSDEVSNAIENIVSVSEENSASIQQVSASTEEMSSQVEEVTASAQSLAETAQQMIIMVSRFKLTNN